MNEYILFNENSYPLPFLPLGAIINQIVVLNGCWIWYYITLLYNVIVTIPHISLRARRLHELIILDQFYPLPYSWVNSIFI